MALGKFRNVRDVSIGTERLPQPKLGVADFFITSIKRRENRQSGERTNVNMVCVRSIDGDQKKGDKAGLVYFDSNQYYMQDLKRLILALVEVDVSEEQEVVNMQCPVADDKGDATEYAQMDELTRCDTAWNSIINEVGAVDENGEPTASGSFDGGVILRVETAQKPDRPHPTEIEQDPVTKEVRPKVIKGYINSYPVKVIPFAEIANTLDESEIVRFFGSEDKLMKLIEIEEAHSA